MQQHSHGDSFMKKKLLASLILATLSVSSYAKNMDPAYDFLPNVKTQQANIATMQKQAIALVKNTLQIHSIDNYRQVRISFIYNNENKVQALLVYLMSSKFKSYDTVKINLTSDFSVKSVIRNYEPTQNDLSQSPNYARNTRPVCPDQTVQFVIGNSFEIQGPSDEMDQSVEREVQRVYQLAIDKGYNPVLLDINNPAGLQPTVEAYENWMSCPNVKGFYNESHGSTRGISLADDMFSYKNVDKYLAMQLNHKFIVFDSCSTFNDPLLASMTKLFKGNSKQYMAGFVPLPFGPSEKTASCVWTSAFDHARLTQDLVDSCSLKNALKPQSYKIKGNGFKFLEQAL